MLRHTQLHLAKQLSLGYTRPESAANPPEYTYSGAFWSILFSLPEWAKIREGFWNIRGGIRLVLKCSKPAEYPPEYSRMRPRQISFGPHSGGNRLEFGCIREGIRDILGRFGRIRIIRRVRSELSDPGAFGHIRPDSGRHSGRYSVLFGHIRGIRVRFGAILVECGSILVTILVGIRLYSGF